MRSHLLVSLVSIVALAGCLSDPTPDSLGTADDGGQGIAVGEPHPGAGGIKPASECVLEPAPSGEPGAGVDGIGTIRWIGLEGGSWGIVADNGTHYDPVNLCKEFQQDGLRVHFGGVERPDMAGTHMWGAYVELEWLQKA